MCQITQQLQNFVAIGKNSKNNIRKNGQDEYFRTLKTNIKVGWVPKLHVGVAYNTQMDLN